MPTSNKKGTRAGATPKDTGEVKDLTVMLAQDQEFLGTLRDLMLMCFEEAALIMKHGEPPQRATTMKLVMPVVARFLAPAERDQSAELEDMRKEWTSMLQEMKG